MKKRSKLPVRCDGYTCSLGSCKQNPDFKLPVVPEGWVCALELYAAGGFSGWTLRPARQDEQRSIERARAIRDAGMLKSLRAN
jgi:hypothetical protein